MTRGRDPIMTCFFLCDRVIRDEITRKWGAIGLFNSFLVESLPMGVFEIWFFCRLADAPRDIRMIGTVVSPHGVVISTCAREFALIDTPQAASPGLKSGWWEIGGRFKELVFTESGEYRVEMNVNGVTLGDTSLHVILAQ